jgi:DNA-binding MarR family transcriptional regulator
VATKAGREAWLAMVELWFLDGQAHDRVHEVAEVLDLSPGQLKAITHLVGVNGIRMGDLAEQWGCDASYITTLADALEARGLVLRTADPNDRRVKMVVLTSSGRALHDRAFALLSEPPAFLDALTATEQRALRDLMRKMASADAAPASHRASA